MSSSTPPPLLPLPNLGSLTREHAGSSDLSRTTISLSTPTEENAIRKAFGLLLLKYLDLQDYVFGSADHCIRARVGDTGNYSEEFLPLFDVDVQFRWNGTAQAKLVLEASPTELTLIHPIALLHPSVAQVFLRQLTALDDLPESLLSYYQAPYDPSKAHFVVDYLLRAAQSRPTAIAHECYFGVPDGLDGEPLTMTYSELEERSNQFARWLEPKLTTESKMVAVCRERDLAFYIVQLGIWKAGACYVSIDPSLPPERKNHILNDCSASLLVTSPSQVSSFASSSTPKFSPESLSDLLDSLPEDSSHINLSTPTTLAYLLYTSGTTGTPKGCLLLHDGLFWAIEAMCLHARPVTQPGDKRLGLASQAFDVHVSEIVQCWALCLTLVSAPRFEVLSDFRGVVERVGITHLGMVPSMLEAMLPEGPEGLPLKYVVSGGEKISDGLIKKWTGRGGVVLANFYGPTEATIGCTSRLVNLHDRKENIGSPFEGCGVGVVRVGAPSPSFAPAGKGFPLPLVPLGTPGELVLSGHLVGVGYHQLEEATGKSFIFAEDGTRYYRTGDLVRMTPNHTLEIMGRIDSQIKLRGVRIEADGVSSVLRDAVSTKGKEVQVHTLIATHPSSSSSEQLISFCTFPTSRPPSPAKLHTSFPRKLISNMLKASENGLASYMRPNFIVPIEGGFPLTGNGKIDQMALRSVFQDTSMDILHGLLTKESLPRGKEDTVELDANGKKVVDVLSDVLNRQCQSSQWDAKTSLWETGLTSLGFAAFTRALNAAFETTRRTSEVMMSETIQDISQLFVISTASTRATAPEDHNGKDYVNSFAELHTTHVQALIPSAHILSILPPFPVQEGVLFHVTQSDSEAYVQHFVYQFPGKADTEKLRSAWKDVQSRVEVLRCVFVDDGDDGYCSVVLNDQGAGDVPFSVQDFSGQDFVQWFSEGECCTVAKEINRGLTEQKVLWRVNLYSEKWMALSLNHAIYDGNSVPILMNLFVEAYTSSNRTKTSPLADIRSTIRPPTDPSVASFWREQFPSNIVSILRRRQYRHISSHTPVLRRRQHTLRTSFSEIQQSSAGGGPLAFFASAFASAGRDVFGWHDDAFACFGVVQSGRTMFEDDVNREHHVIAPLVCVVPLVVPFHNVRETQRRLGAIVPFQHTPLGRVHRILGLPEMVDVLFSVRYSDAEESERKEREEKCGGLKNVWVSPEVPEFVYAMEVVVREERDLIELRVGYSDVDVEEEEVGEVFSRMDQVVKDLLSASSSTSSSSRLDELLTPKEEPKDDQPVDEVLEESLLSTIRSYLKLDSSIPFTPLTSFISLGLSSLRAIGLAKALTKESGKRFAAIDVVQKDSVRGLVRMLASSERHDGDVEEINDVTEMMRQDILEHDVLLDDGDSVVVGGCTSLQSGMLTQTVNSDDGSLYIHAFTFLLSASTSPDVLHQAWVRTVSQLDILRATFHFSETHGRWTMAIHSKPYIHFVKEDRNSIDGVASSLLHLDLTKTGVKFHIICVGAAHYSIVVMHHALYDGAAVPALFERLKRNYHFSVSPREVKEEPENIPQFLPIADRIVSREHLGLRFWSSKLRDFSPFTFPRAMSSKSWRASHDIPLSMVDFATTCAKWGVHQQVFGMAAWAKALAKRSGKVDVVFGMVTSGRLIEGSELVVGPVFNTIPVRARLNSSNLVLLKSIQKWNTDAIRHQHTGLRDIQRELRVGRLCDSLFVFQPSADTPHDTEDGGGESLWEYVSGGQGNDEGQTQYAVNIEMHANADRSRFKFFASCSAEVMSKEDLRSLLQEMALSILDFVEHPNTSCIDAAALDDDSFESTASSTLVPSRSSSSSPRRPSKIPWTQEQHTLLSILSDFGNVPLDRLDESTSLGALGIDSISSIQIAGLVRKKGLGRMKAGDLARCERVGEVLSLLSVFKSSSQKDFNRPPLVEIPSDVRQQVLVRIPSAFHSEVERILPVASGMEWNIGGWCASGGQSFKHAFVFSLPPHTIGDLKRSWNRLCERHAILRANFRPVQWEEHRAVMYVTSHVEFDWSELEGDLSDVTRLARAFAVEEVSPELPQTRVGIVRRGNDSAWFVLALHHFQYDAWSLRLLLDDLRMLLENRPPVASSGLDDFLSIVTSYANRPHWQKEFGSSFRPSLFLPKPPPLRNHILHILSYIAGLLRRRLRWLFQFIIITYRKLRTLCIGSPPVQPQISRQSKVYRFFTPEEVGHLEERSKLLDRPLANILIAAWGRLQAEASGTLDATFSLSTSGRTLDTIPDIENLAIPTYNILPLHVTSAYQQPLAEIAKEIHLTLASRSSEVEQTRMADISRYIGLEIGQKLCNVYVNVVKLPPNHGGSQWLKPVKLPYHARPWTLEHERNSVLPEFDYTHTVEIVFSSSGTLTFSLETDIAEAYMDTIAHKWKNLVQEALS